MLITYDRETDAMFIELRAVQAVDSKDIEDGVTVALDADGHIVGLEILDASERLGTAQPLTVTLKDLAYDAEPAGS